ncbi:MAG: ATP-binding protein [Deltaproteobacteria bacterium]|nr:ATP-binding protein [Deltaproteobacteria bacterium]
MINEYHFHNAFWQDIKSFETTDPHLAELKNLHFVHPLNWWNGIDWSAPGIFILTGGRQIGKSTSTKLLIQDCLKKKRFQPSQIFYLPCDQIDDHHHLTRVIKLFLESINADPFLLVLDEITYVTEWDRGIKALADEGRFRNGFCLITGSDTALLKRASSRFPGRRGNADKTDFHLYPLNFREYLELTNPVLNEAKTLPKLLKSFNDYLVCGGFLRAVNEFHAQGQINKATFLTFEQWIRGDFEKQGKSTRNLMQIISSIFQTTTSQMTYSRLTEKVGEISKDTVIDYCHLLQRMDIITILEAFDQNTRRGFNKKARKFLFADPFITGVIESWLIRERFISTPLADSVKVESAVSANIARRYPAYYIKADGEVDLVFIEDRLFFPVEIKWTNQLRGNDIKQIKKYKGAVIITKDLEPGMIDGIPTQPVPEFLLSRL